MPEPTEGQEEFVYRPRRVGGGEFVYSRRPAEPDLDPSLFKGADERVEAPLLDEPDIAHVEEDVIETETKEEPLEDEPLAHEALVTEPVARPARGRRRRGAPPPVVAKRRPRRMDPIVLVAAFFLGVAVGAALIVGARQLRESLEPTPVPPTAAPQTPVPTQTPPADQAGATNFSGTGSSTTEAFALEAGLTVFELSHAETTENFSVDLIPAGSDEQGQRIVGVIGPYSGSTLSEADAGRYRLKVQAGGKWSVAVRQPRPTTAEAINSLTGTGDVAAGPTALSNGPRRFRITHQGVGPFKVTLYNNLGKPVDVLAEGTRRTFADKVVPVEQGIYWFDVNADGDWTIAIS